MKKFFLIFAPLAGVVLLTFTVASLTLTWLGRTKEMARNATDSFPAIKGEEKAVLASAPNVPPAITRNYATRVILEVEVKEEVKQIADGVSYTYWSFGEESPGKFIRVREGDLVDVRLHNHPDNSLAHNIDFHAATGPGGGGEASFVAPGHSANFTWRAMRPGLYLYHCVAAPAGLHIANGMYGQILVEPKEGLPKVDREFQLVQGEFYTEGKYGEQGPQKFSIEKAIKEQPEYVVFNGHVGALMGERALKAKAGERIRLFLANAGPSLISSFHVVGEIFDNVYAEGGIIPNQHNVQTTVVPVGGSAMVEFTVDVPGEYTLVDHSMFRAFNKGAMGQLVVDGGSNALIFTGRTSEAVYNPGTRLVKMGDPAAPGADPNRALGFAEQMEHGAQVYGGLCVACHQAGGQGLPGVFPPLAGSDFLMADKKRAIAIVANGLKGELVVNGQRFNSEMPKFPLNDQQIASVLTYVRNKFGNSGDVVTLSEVLATRRSFPQSGPLLASELVKSSYAAIPPETSAPSAEATTLPNAPADNTSVSTERPEKRY